MNIKKEIERIQSKPIQEWTMDEMVYVLMHSPRAYTAYPPDSYFDLEPESRTNEDMENASFERGRDRK